MRNIEVSDPTGFAEWSNSGETLVPMEDRDWGLGLGTWLFNAISQKLADSVVLQTRASRATGQEARCCASGLGDQGPRATARPQGNSALGINALEKLRAGLRSIRGTQAAKSQAAFGRFQLRQ